MRVRLHMIAMKKLAVQVGKVSFPMCYLCYNTFVICLFYYVIIHSLYYEGVTALLMKSTTSIIRQYVTLFVTYLKFLKFLVWRVV